MRGLSRAPPGHRSPYCLSPAKTVALVGRLAASGTNVFSNITMPRQRPRLFCNAVPSCVES